MNVVIIIYFLKLSFYHLFVCVRNFASNIKGGTLILFENRVLRIFESNRDEVTEGWKKYVKRNFIIFTLYKILVE